MDSMVWAVVKMIVALGIVSTLLILLAKILRRTRMAKGGLLFDSGIKILTTQGIAPQKYISLVEIGGEVFALGISETQITLLTKIENRDFLEKMRGKGVTKAIPFSVLQSLPLRYKGPRAGLLKRLYGGK